VQATNDAEDWVLPKGHIERGEDWRCPDFRWRLSDGSLTRFD